MSKKLYYPTKYELMEVLSSIANNNFLKNFAQERGIFITNANHKELANEISNLFLEDEDLEIIRKEAYQENAKHTLSGFIINGGQDFSLKNVYESIFTEGGVKTGQVLSAPRRLPDPAREIYQGSIIYSRKKVGRIEFLQDEVSAFEFTMEQISPGTWKVELDCNRSTDTKELRELLDSRLPRDLDVITIEPKLLTKDLSILFFDRLAKEGLNSEWDFRDVKHLTLKMGNSDTKDDSDLKDVTEEKQLADITQAILKGQNLRNNPFVKSSVDNGYRFNAMTYEYFHATEPYVIQIKAEFKGRPKVFEVSVVSYEATSGTGATRLPTKITSTLDRKMRSEFWNNAKGVYNDLITKKKVTAKK